MFGSHAGGYRSLAVDVNGRVCALRAGSAGADCQRSDGETEVHASSTYFSASRAIAAVHNVFLGLGAGPTGNDFLIPMEGGAAAGPFTVLGSGPEGIYDFALSHWSANHGMLRSDASAFIASTGTLTEVRNFLDLACAQGCAFVTNTGSIRTAAGPVSPPAVDPVRPFIQVAVNPSATCALRTDGTIACNGLASAGGLAPTAPAGTRFIELARGGAGPYAHLCALRSDGVVQCWGAVSGELLSGVDTF
jgi:hypothetical protein